MLLKLIEIEQQQVYSVLQLYHFYTCVTDWKTNSQELAAPELVYSFLLIVLNHKPYLSWHWTVRFASLMSILGPVRWLFMKNCAKKKAQTRLESEACHSRHFIICVHLRISFLTPSHRLFKYTMRFWTLSLKRSLLPVIYGEEQTQA